MNPLILIGAAAILYYLYSQSQGTAATTPTASAPSTTPTSTAQTQTTAPSSTPTSSAYSGPLPSTYAAVVTAALQGLGPGGGTSLQTPDVWNWYLMQAFPNVTAPAPETLFPGNSTPHAPVPFATWWNAVVPLLPAGMSGITDARFVVPQNSFAQEWYV